MGYSDNIYYHPEKHGLKVVAAVDPSLCYEFDSLVFFQDKRTGELYAARDSGCSCPMPFELTKREDLEGPLTKNQAYDLIDEHASRFTPSEYDPHEDVPGLVAEAKSAIAGLLPL